MWFELVVSWKAPGVFSVMSRCLISVRSENLEFCMKRETFYCGTEKKVVTVLEKAAKGNRGIHVLRLSLDPI